MNVLWRQAHRSALTLCDLSRHFPANRADLALEIPQACLPGVLRNDGADTSVSKLDVAVFQSMLAELLRNEMLLGDRPLLFFCVARQLDHFHAVAKGRLNGVKLIGRCNEQHRR